MTWYAKTYKMEQPPEVIVRLFDRKRPLETASAVIKECWQDILRAHKHAGKDVRRNRVFATLLFLTLWCGGDRAAIERHFIIAHGGADRTGAGYYTTEDFLR